VSKKLKYSRQFFLPSIMLLLMLLIIIGVGLFYLNYQIPTSLWSLRDPRFNDHIFRGLASVVFGVRLVDLCVSCFVDLVCMNVATLPQPLFHHGQRRLHVPIMPLHVSRKGNRQRRKRMNKLPKKYSVPCLS